MVDTAFLRSDALPGRAALGYLSGEGLRTNVLHLPVLGVGDGGVYSTAADLHHVLGLALCGPDRVAGARDRDDPPAQRLAGGVQALRSGVPPGA